MLKKPALEDILNLKTCDQTFCWILSYRYVVPVSVAIESRRVGAGAWLADSDDHGPWSLLRRLQISSGPRIRFRPGRGQGQAVPLVQVFDNHVCFLFSMSFL